MLEKEEHAEKSARRLEGNIYEDGDWEMGLGKFPVILGPVRSFGLSEPAERCQGDLAWLRIQLGAWICAELEPVCHDNAPQRKQEPFQALHEIPQRVLCKKPLRSSTGGNRRLFGEIVTHGAHGKVAK